MVFLHLDQGCMPQQLVDFQFLTTEESLGLVNTQMDQTLRMFMQLMHMATKSSLSRTLMLHLVRGLLSPKMLAKPGDLLMISSDLRFRALVRSMDFSLMVLDIGTVTYRIFSWSLGVEPAYAADDSVGSRDSMVFV